MSSHSRETARWFFLLIAGGVLFLFWKVIAPYALVLLTAGIVAIILSPVDRHFAKIFPWPRMRTAILVLAVFIVVFLPLLWVAYVAGAQAADLVKSSIGEGGWVSNVSSMRAPFLDKLPFDARGVLASLNLVATARSLASWAIENMGSLFSSTAKLAMQTLIFFIALYYMLADRRKIFETVLDLSPFQDSTDKQIVHKIVQTVRQVVFGALVIAVIKSVLATIGMTIFGVPGAFLWGALIIVASQVPIVGVGIILLPAIVYLLVIGETGSAIGLAVWSALIVGMVDNLLSPMLLQGRTNMHALLILISILGGIQLFGWIGFIAGPTVLAAVMVVVELYKSGVLERSGSRV
ncbi:MAG: AI-2E family transporter [Patescibacteria group bacterium]